MESAMMEYPLAGENGRYNPPAARNSTPAAAWRRCPIQRLGRARPALVMGARAGTRPLIPEPLGHELRQIGVAVVLVDDRADMAVGVGHALLRRDKNVRIGHIVQRPNTLGVLLERNRAQASGVEKKIVDPLVDPDLELGIRRTFIIVKLHQQEIIQDSPP